jgi:hypothetical protein
MKFQLWLICLFFSASLFSQTTITGQVRDVTTGEMLPNANVFIDGGSVGSASDIDGSYLLSLPDDIGTEVTIIVEYIGYETYLNLWLLYRENH